MKLKFAWHDIAGTIGVALIVIAYLLLQLGKLRSASLSYSLINGVGASLVIVSLVFDFNLSAFLIEAFWVLISLIGVVRYFTAKSMNA